MQHVKLEHMQKALLLRGHNSKSVTFFFTVKRIKSPRVYQLSCYIDENYLSLSIQTGAL